ncbi:MAG: galactokinase [Oscillospiraceae bacterium]|nr:galactokinase [Oscillospiraceae bacterium]
MKYSYDQVYHRPEDRARLIALRDALLADGHRPQEIRFFTAPGRTELGGNHTDHQHGLVLAAAVDVDTVAAVAPNHLGRIRLWSQGFPPCEIDIVPTKNPPAPKESALSLLQGMAELCEPLGQACGLDIRASSTVLPGGGLSSSASFEVLLAEIFNVLWCGDRLSPLKLAELGQRVENDWFGKPSGRLDQAASAVGGAAYMSFADPDAPVVEKLELDLEAAGYALFIINCGAGHADLTGEYAAIPGELKKLCACFGKAVLQQVPEADFYARLPELRTSCGDRAVLRAMHIYEENRRVTAQRDALRRGDFAAYLRLVRESGLSSWRLLQNITPAGSAAEQPMALTLALCEKLLAGQGACRVHGGGFAGTAQAYVPLDMAESFRTEMERLLGPGACQRRIVRPVGAAEIEV